MVTLDEIRANGWQPDPNQTNHHFSSDWVRDPETGQKLRDELCDRWMMSNRIAYVSVAAYEPAKRIEPLFGYANADGRV
jgi:hypothetical protein